jgi:hypothetical protein
MESNQSYFWEDKHSGLLVKARPDIVHHNMIVDLKTIATVSVRSFQYAMVEGGYHIQAAMIRDGIRELEGRDIPNIINVCIEKEYPYSIGIYILDDVAIEEGHMKYKQALLDIATVLGNNNFAHLPPERVSLPKWYF